MATIHLKVNGMAVEAEEGWTVAAALLNADISAFRTSVAGETRAPLCGMGVCFECRVTINGEAHVRACLVDARDGMEVVTGG